MAFVSRPESTAWQDWQDLYDFIDQLRSDLDAGAAGGGAPMHSVVLPNNAVWDDVLGVYDDADATDNICYFNNPIVQESSLFIQKEFHLIGGPLAKLQLVTDVNLSGSNQQIAIGYGTIPAVTLSGFEIEHDRVAGGSGMRTLAISIFGNGTTNVCIDKIRFTNITSDCVIVRDESGTISPEPPDGIYVTRCVANEWYESFFNHHEGSARNVYVIGNICNVSKGHPNGAVSRPYACIINIEDDAYSGLIENVHIIKNSFTSLLYNFSLGVAASPGSGTDFNDSIGFALRQNDNPDWRAHRIHVCGNLFDGWDLGLYHLETQRSSSDGTSANFPGVSYVYYLGNTFQANGNNIARVDNIGGPSDVIIIGDNAFIKHDGGQTALLQPDSATSFPTYGPTTIIEQPPNRVTGP